MSAAPVVTTATGMVSGETVAAPDGRSVHRFLGLPYAAAPTGDLRWRAPIAPAPWPGVREATSFAPAAPQADAVESALPGFSPEVMGDDCLALNVWTPALDGTRPVVVWFPGGAYLSGGTAQPVYDAARLAAEGDLVVVTVGYRLGALGFLAPEGDGLANCGLRDQLAALAWVREHASVFGGDGRRLTVMGESAGAGSVLHLLASPARGDAFDRAIVQSGQPTTLEASAASDVAGVFAHVLGLGSPDAARLRDRRVDWLLDAQQQTLGKMLGKVGPMPFAPVIDGDICDGAIVEGLVAGRAASVDVVVGTTRDELSLFPDPRAASLDDDRLARRIAALGPVEPAGVVVGRYRALLGDTVSNGRIWDAARTDAMMRVPIIRVLDALARDDVASRYLYRFDWEAPDLGAAHAVDVPFTFGTFDREGWGAIVGHDARAEALGIRWRASWSAFATRGDPGPQWSPYGTERPTTVFAPDGVRSVDDPDAATRRCWMG